MSKKITPQENSANQQNANKGTSGINKQYSQNQGNKGKQGNPNQGGKSNLPFIIKSPRGQQRFSCRGWAGLQLQTETLLTRKGSGVRIPLQPQIWGSHKF